MTIQDKYCILLLCIIAIVGVLLWDRRQGE